MAYLVNAGDECTLFGKPAAAMSFVGLGSKNLDALTFTETLFGRVELGYGADRLGLGTLPSAIRTRRTTGSTSATATCGCTPGTSAAW